MTEPRKFVTIGGVDRREFLARSGGLASVALLLGCESRGPKSAEKLLRYAERKNLVVERALFRHTAMDKVQSGAHDHHILALRVPEQFLGRFWSA